MAREAYIAAFDELHTIGSSFIDEYRSAESESAQEEVLRRAEDSVLDFLVDAYLLGWLDAGDDIGVRGKEPADMKHINDVVLKQFDGKDITDRVREYVSGDEPDALQTALGTELHRVYATGGYELTESLPDQVRADVGKRWDDMQDDRVRDTHRYLSGMTIGLDEEFYTYDGDHAPAPGLFRNVGNNVNCRCWLTYIRLREQP